MYIRTVVGMGIQVRNHVYLEGVNVGICVCVYVCGDMFMCICMWAYVCLVCYKPMAPLH